MKDDPTRLAVCTQPDSCFKWYEKWEEKRNVHYLGSGLICNACGEWLRKQYAQSCDPFPDYMLTPHELKLRNLYKIWDYYECDECRFRMSPNEYYTRRYEEGEVFCPRCERVRLANYTPGMVNPQPQKDPKKA